ncbi:MAG: argininosuccinate synthase [Nitrospiraceae bacterium]|nr:argininosuccinate synthase [Nitrospiraceae bacterium]
MSAEKRKVVLAYSGGLDTSVILKWLIEESGYAVVAFCADLGQGEDFSVVREKARAVGACSVWIEDLRDVFVSEFVFPMLRANAVYEGCYLLGTAIARPLIAKRQVEIARKEGAEAIAHGATGKGNDQVRFELAARALDPDIAIIAPWRTWPFRSRNDLLSYAKQHGIPVSASPAKPYSVDQNLFHVSSEGGILEDPWKEAPADVYQVTSAPESSPDIPRYLEIQYNAGNPVAVDDQQLSPVDLLAYLNTVGGMYGIGRLDLVENRYVGMKSRGIYETPGGTILHVAHRGIESITMDREVVHLRDALIPQYAKIVYEGYWFSPEREMLQRAIDEAQRHVTGTVRVKLYKGTCAVVGRRSDDSLYREDLATFEEDSVYKQQDAEGFIRLNGLRLAIQASRRRGPS